MTPSSRSRLSLVPALLALGVFGISGCRSPRNSGSTASLAPRTALSSRGQFTYVQIDVGQGDSELLISPDGHAMLVDAGPPGESDKILSVLRSHGVSKLDYLVESHPHADHIGSMRQVIENGPPVQQFLASGYQHNSAVQRQMLLAVKEKAIKGSYARKGSHFTLGNVVTFDVLQPQTPLLKNTDSDPNNNSVVLRVSYGKVHFLLTGDMEGPERERLIDSNPSLQSDVLKVAHHGSHNGTDGAFLQQVRPRYALISCAVENDYGHPHGEALAALGGAGVDVFRTDLQGDITLQSDGQEITVQTERQAALPITLTGKEVAARKGDVLDRVQPDNGDLTSRPSRKRSRPTGDSDVTNAGDGAAPAHRRRQQPDNADASASGDQAASGFIVGNRRSKVYHLPGEGGALPASSNRVYFNSEEDARRAGYRRSGE